MTGDAKSLRTRLVQAGRAQHGAEGGVNPPVQRASSLLFQSVAALYADDQRTYGLDGMLVHDAVRDAVNAIEGGAGASLVPSGLAACTLALLSVLKAGDDVLVTDSVYGPTRRFCDGLCARLGVTTHYYDPRIGAGIADLITAKTRIIWLESPGSLTFEVQDVPAITAAAAKAGVLTAIDNTYGAGVLFKPFDHGVDLSIQALTKYQAGHADVLAGAIIAREKAMAAQIKDTVKALGVGPGSAEDAYLTLRGLRTMTLRMQAQAESAMIVADWLRAHPMVAEVLHPALPGARDHALFMRDFTGGAGLFSFVLKAGVSSAAVDGFCESRELFGLGYSWGGYESLILPCDRQVKRTATHWRAQGPLVRLSIGLEDPADLIADLGEGLSALG
jgi:cysteine-S-conjugate beta-lyase